MKTRNRRLLSLLLSAEIAAGIVVSAVPAAAAGPLAGTPYDANGTYDVTVPHVVINQYYGSGISTGGAADYGFIELYNPTGSAIDLSTWSVQYADRMALVDTGTGELPLTGPTGPWEVLNLSGTIPAHGSYLIRAAASKSPSIKMNVKTGDQDFGRTPADMTTQNKGMKVVLMSNRTPLQPENVNPSADKPAGFVDMLGAAGNDTGSTIDGAEGDYPKEAGGPSKNIALRRVDFADTDSNVNDFALIDYKSLGSAAAAPFYPHNAGDGSWAAVPDPVAISTPSLPNAYKGVAYSAGIAASGGVKPYAFAATGLPSGLSIDADTGAISGTPAQDAPASSTVNVTVTDSQSGTISKPYTLNVGIGHPDTVNITKLGSFIAGEPNEDGGVAEIVKYNPENRKFYSVNGSSTPATLDIVSLDSQGKPAENAQRVNIEDAVAAHLEGFEYGDFTSVDIDTQHNLVYAAIQEKAYDKNGAILVFDYDGNFVKSYEAGVQPDMIEVTKDGRYVLTADEAEDREGGADPEKDPKGSITIVDTLDGTVKHVLFDDESVIDDNVHLRGAVVDGVITGPAADKTAAERDLEPEYIALSADESVAYVSLQEGNAIGTIDIANGKVTSVKGLGYKDLNLPENALDLVKDGAIKFENVPFKGMYMPDGIDTYTVNGKTYVFTANEGDSTEWPGRTNVSTIKDMKAKLDPNSASARFLAGKTAYDGVEIPSDMGPDGIYLYGARSFSIWDADSMDQVYDSHNDFEKITAERIPAYFNSNHADVSFDKRSPKKGPEPEYVKVGQAGDKTYAFVGLERVSGIMTYDVTDPAHPVFANYVNTRDFAHPDNMQTDAGPEGIDFIPAAASPTGKPLILVANEVGGTISVLQMEVSQTPNNGTGSGVYVPVAPDNGATVDGSAVTLETKAATDASGNATAAVTAQQIDQAIEKLSGAVKTVAIKAAADASAKQNTVSLPAAAVDKLAASAADAIVLDAGIGQVTFDKAALTAIANGATTGDVAIAVAKKDPADVTANLPADKQAAVAAAVGSHPVYDFSVTADGKKVAGFAGGSAEIRVPYTPAAGENPNAIIVYYIADNGELALVPQASFDPATGTLRFAVKHFSTYALAYSPVNFADIANSFAKDHIAYLTARNIIQGKSASVFDPKANVTRADFTLIFARAAGVDLSAYSAGGFGDVGADAYYAKSVAWAASAGIASGVSANRFSPNANITREQMVAMIARFADARKFELPASAPGIAFTDAASISPFAREAAAAVQQAGIINGQPSGSGTKFAPKQFATREETAKMIAVLYRLMTK
ncbi:S-layer homology domain-containing protein [Paenibacillus sp. UNC496MF]|uniref:choice-of-anchor I family protein n=1 Tax=Paenibacillus sp. UNC496MF TaxID=1502753 RepID=UPI0008EECF1B|nr:choice-of-anchor I family protein [Paenibacillus sp. UNC496MF]SFI73214.1 S-layer homology domain-containing protein [Paenibacillus sp. UNC496MF]